MALNRNYGDFGFIQMPRLLAESAVVISLYTYLAYAGLIKPLMLKFYNFSLIDYNLAIPVSRYINTFSWLDINFANVFHTIMFTTLALLLIYYAHKHTKEPLRKYGLITIPAYLICYSILASIAIISVFFDLARGKIQKW